MLKSNGEKSPLSSRKSGRAVALKYDKASGAPIIIASGMGYTAERMVEVAEDNGVPIYEDNSLATMLSQLQLGQQIPTELYQVIVDIYVYFLNFDPNDPDKLQREREEAKRLAKAQAQAQAQANAMQDSVETTEEPPHSRPVTLDEQMANLYGDD